jgi:hypothetical protein
MPILTRINCMVGDDINTRCSGINELPYKPTDNANDDY